MNYYLVDLEALEISEGPLSEDDAWYAYHLIVLGDALSPISVLSELELAEFNIVPPYPGSFTLVT